MNKKVINLVLIPILLLAVFQGCAQQQKEAPQEEILQPVTNISMKLTSPAFSDNGKIPSKYTCDGEDINPPLIISETPAAAKSLALIVDDPDAPAGDWVHWTLWNISADTKEIAEGSIPAGAVQGLTDFGYNKWGGPCPPSGVHHYQFKLYALDTVLNISGSSKKRDIEKAMAGHVIDQTQLTGLYQKK
jgi:Raf kinase inhibitor-like YbhB/YbcL family protein